MPASHSSQAVRTPAARSGRVCAVPRHAYGTQRGDEGWSEVEVQNLTVNPSGVGNVRASVEHPRPTAAVPSTASQRASSTHRRRRAPFNRSSPSPEGMVGPGGSSVTGRDPYPEADVGEVWAMAAAGRAGGGGLPALSRRSTSTAVAGVSLGCQFWPVGATGGTSVSPPFVR